MALDYSSCAICMYQYSKCSDRSMKLDDITGQLFLVNHEKIKLNHQGTF